MKRNYIIMMLLASFTIVLSSCKKDILENTEDTTSFTLAVSGNNGEVITVNGTDVTKEVTVSSDKNLTRDITVDLISDNAKGVLSAQSVTIGKGDLSAVVNITFKAADFPEGTDEIPIKVTASAADKYVEFSPAFTTFNVKGEAGKEALPELTVVVAGGSSVIDTFDGDAQVKIEFTLTKPATSTFMVNCEYGNLESDDFIGAENLDWITWPLKMNVGETSFTAVINVLKNKEGRMSLTFSLNNKVAVLKTDKLDIQFVKKQPTEAMVSISTDGKKDVVARDYADVTRKIRVSLGMAADKDVTVNLTATSSNDKNGTLSASSVTIQKGELEQFVTIAFPKEIFTKGTSADVTVTAECSDVPLKTKEIVFFVTGPRDKMDLKLTYYFVKPEGTTVFFPEGSQAGDKMECQLYFYTANQARVTRTAELSLEVTGDGVTEADYEVMPVKMTTDYYDSYAYMYFDVYGSAIGKTLTITAVSDDITFKSEPIDLLVTSLSWPPAHRSSPKAEIGSSWNNYSAVLRSVSVNESDNFTAIYGKDYYDKYDDNAYDQTVAVGDNAVVIGAQHGNGMNTSTEFTCLAYADFNNDGRFDGPGEELLLSRAVVSVPGVPEKVAFNMKVPEGTTGSFPLRIGVFEAYPSFFADGYFLTASETIYCQIYDIKCTVAE